MARQAGDELHASTEVIGHPDPNESTEPGDAVSIDGDGYAAPAGDGDELFGGRTRNRQSDEVASIAHDGVIVLKVADGVEGGEGLGTSAEAGELAVEAGGPAVALSDEGGEYRGASIPDGHAAVLLR